MDISLMVCAVVNIATASFNVHNRNYGMATLSALTSIFCMMEFIAIETGR